jgi:hypothetical protein
MRLKAVIVLFIFVVILYLPFSVLAASGHMFSGLPIPVLNIFGSGDQNSAPAEQYNAPAAQYGATADQCVAAASQSSSTMDQYAQNLPKPSFGSAVDIDYMRNHMNVLKQPGQSAKQCAACHTSKEEFCDRCHSFVGINPTFDY